MRRNAFLSICMLVFTIALSAFAPSASAAGPALQVMAPAAAQSVSVNVVTCGAQACADMAQCGTLPAHTATAWTTVSGVTLYQGSSIKIMGYNQSACSGPAGTAQATASIGATQMTAVQVNLT